MAQPAHPCRPAETDDYPRPAEVVSCPVSGERPYSATLDGPGGAIRLHGAIDVFSAPCFRDDLVARLVPAGNTSVDLTDVQFFSAAGAGVLVAGWRQARAHGTRMDVVVRLGSIPQRVLEICALPYRLA